MISYWTDKRANGTPIDAGTFARVIDLEDGTHPQYVYGATMDEVLSKIERNHANAQRALHDARKTPTAAATSAAILSPTRLSADDKMRYTLDLQNPAKAAAAMVKLIADETGVDPLTDAKRRYGELAVAWEHEHPEFYQHPGNRRILGNEAIRRAGGNPALVTREILTQCFNELLADGQLFEGQNESTTQPATPSTFPAETQVQRTERPRQGFTTGYRPRGGGGNPPPRTLKYSEDQYWTMPASKRRELLMSRDPDFEAAARAYDPAEQRAS